MVRRKVQTENPVQGERWRSMGVPALLALLTFLAFSNSFSAGFILDNKGLLLQDPRIREFTLANIRQILQHTYWWPTGETGLYRPFTTLSFLFNYAVLGNAQGPAGYHWINFLLHLGNVFLVYALARRFLRELWPAFFAAALWAVHPVLTESVTNMIGRSDLLSAMAILSGFLMYLKAAETAGSRRIVWLAGLEAVTAMGVFSKENAVAIVGVIVLYELTWWKERRQGRVLLQGCAATLVPIAVMLYCRYVVLAASKPAEFAFVDNPIVGADFWAGRFTAINVIARYLWLTVWPARLSIDYSYAQIPLAHGALTDWLACIAVLAAVLLAAAMYGWNRTAFFFATFAGVTFVPMANLLFPIGAIMAERFLYMPTIGLLACVVMAVYAAGKRVPTKNFAPIVLCVITVAFTVRTWLRNADWQEERALMEASARTSPNSFKVHLLLATALYANGGAGSDLDGAIEEADRAVAILNSLPDSRNALEAYRMAGNLYLIKGDAVRERNPSQGTTDYQRARLLLERSIAIDNSGGAAYDRNGGTEWARRHHAITAYKNDPEARWMLVTAYLRLGYAQQASIVAGEALALHPAAPEAYREISFAYSTQHRMDDAAVALIEGMLMTSDFSLKSNLLDLYRSAFAGSCAISTGPGGPDVNLTCDLFRKHFCAAALESLKSAVEAGRFDVARQQKQSFLQTNGCPAGPLDSVLPD